jgi:lipopolysaccharide/colanic/teichoic acid biosynthesis glycosyltransferase
VPIDAATKQRLSSPLAAGQLRSGVGPGWSRRALDIAVSLGALLLSAPVIVLVAVAIRCTSPGSILFRQVRIGQGKRPFVILKFRTMRAGSGGPEVTAADDLRVTWIGRRLRSAGLDELPQLLNILRGEMTLVGPRPETPALARRYPRACAVVFDHRPGLTGPSQVRLRDKDVLPTGSQATLDFEEHYLERFVPIRTALDLDYLADPSLRRTLGYLFETAVYLSRPVRRAVRQAVRRAIRRVWPAAPDTSVAPTFVELGVVELRDQAPDRNW